MDAIISEKLIRRFDLRFDRKGRLLPSGPNKAALYLELQELRDDLWTEMRRLRTELVNEIEHGPRAGGVRILRGTSVGTEWATTSKRTRSNPVGS